MRARRLTVTILVLSLLAIGTSVAGAQQAPSLGAPEPSETAPPPVTTTTADGGLDPWQQVLIFAAGIVLLGGIAFAILGDARERTRGVRAPSDPPPEGVTHQHKQRAKRQARTKAKAARAQRRRNR